MGSEKNEPYDRPAGFYLWGMLKVDVWGSVKWSIQNDMIWFGDMMLDWITCCVSKELTLIKLTRQAMYCTYNVTLRRVRATIVAMENQ